MSACEAIWRLLRFSIHIEVPSVERLPIHLPGDQNVLFSAEDSPEEVLNRANMKQTKLMAFFAYNQAYPQQAQYLYQEFPQYFV